MVALAHSNRLPFWETDADRIGIHLWVAPVRSFIIQAFVHGRRDPVPARKVLEDLSMAIEWSIMDYRPTARRRYIGEDPLIEEIEAADDRQGLESMRMRVPHMPCMTENGDIFDKVILRAVISEARRRKARVFISGAGDTFRLNAARILPLTEMLSQAYAT